MPTRDANCRVHPESEMGPRGLPWRSQDQKGRHRGAAQAQKRDQRTRQGSDSGEGRLRLLPSFLMSPVRTISSRATSRRRRRRRRIKPPRHGVQPQFLSPRKQQAGRLRVPPSRGEPRNEREASLERCPGPAPQEQLPGSRMTTTQSPHSSFCSENRNEASRGSARSRRRARRELKSRPGRAPAPELRARRRARLAGVPARSAGPCAGVRRPHPAPPPRSARRPFVTLPI